MTKLIFVSSITFVLLMGFAAHRLKTHQRSVASQSEDHSDVEYVRELVKKYPELAWLAGKVEASPDMAEGNQTQTFSQAIFHTSYPEFDRTALSMSIIKWILEGQYETLTAAQNPTIKLSKKSFDQLQMMAKSVLDTPEKKEAMMVYMAIHDLGKSASFAQEAHSLGIESVDHDKILSELIKKKPELLPSFKALPSSMQEVLKQGLNGEFNVSQFIQGENIAASLEGFTKMDTLSRSFYLFHAMMDIAGVAGHANTHGSAILTESTFQNFRLGIESLDLLEQKKSLSQVYWNYFEQQGQRFGWPMKTKKDQAVLRLAMMFRASDASAISKLHKILESLPANISHLLVSELNKSGIQDSATLIYYAPAFLSNAVKVNGIDDGLQQGLTVLANIFQAAKRQKLPAGIGVRTINIREFAEAVKEGKLKELVDRPIIIEYLNQQEGKISFSFKGPNCAHLVNSLKVVNALDDWWFEK